MKMQFVCAFLLTTLVVSARYQYEEKERYIVLLKKGATDEQIEEVIQMVETHESLPREELFIKSNNSLLPIFFGNILEETANKISKLDIVDVIEKNQIVKIEKAFDDSEISVSESTDLYNLDIIDDQNCIDGTYQPFNYGYGVDIYILDSGINYDHEDFGWWNQRGGSRAMYIGYDAVDTNTGSYLQGRDCNGHGTHCAGIAAGLYSGVAEDANLYSMRVLGCDGRGSTEWVLYGLTEIYWKHVDNSKRSDFVGSILSMSLGLAQSSVYNSYIDTLVSIGIVVSTASGNDALDACTDSPGNSGSNINVGSHGYEETTCKKPMAYDSNYGACVDIMAPGMNIKSADYTSNTAYTLKSGTSMACPHVSGVIALMKAGDNTLTPNDIKNRIKNNGIADIDRSSMPAIVQQTSFARRLYVTPNLIA